MFGFDFSKITQVKNPGCKACDLYHTKKFNGFTCVCDCHDAAKLEENLQNQDISFELDWSQNEEITKPMGK